ETIDAHARPVQMGKVIERAAPPADPVRAAAEIEDKLFYLRFEPGHIERGIAPPRARLRLRVRLTQPVHTILLRILIRRPQDMEIRQKYPELCAGHGQTPV